MKILNLYAGIGGNRKLWGDEHDITAVEMTGKIAAIYQQQHPNDIMVVGDALQYAQDHRNEFDLIWASPPCQSHSKMVKATRHKVQRIPDMTSLYGLITFLEHFFDGKWVVENVVPYYKPLIEPTAIIGRHAFWSNFPIIAEDVRRPKGFINQTNTAGANALKDWLGIQYEGNVYYEGNHCPAQVLRNCVHPLIGKQILDNLK